MFYTAPALHLQELPLKIIHMILSKLSYSPNGLSRFSRTCKTFYNIAAPVLYHRLHLSIPGEIGHSDSLMASLDALSGARDKTLSMVKEFKICGFWYRCYDEIESDLGSENLISPAVGMLNVLVALLVRRMENLKSFTWNVQVAPTETLILTLCKAPKLEKLCLRLSTDSTEAPYHFPEVSLGGFRSLKSLTFEELNSERILEEASYALQFSPDLDRLKITAAHELDGISFARVFQKIPEGKQLQLTFLDMRGFGDYKSSDLIWKSVNPATLKELVIRSPQTVENSGDDGSRVFWESMMRVKVRLRVLYTDILAPSLLEYLSTFTGLEDLFLLPCSNSMFPTDSFLEEFISGPVLANCANSLKRLALYVRDGKEKACQLVIQRDQIIALTSMCVNLRQLGIELMEDDLPVLLTSLHRLPKLSALHVIRGFDSTNTGSLEIAAEIANFVREHPVRLQYVGIDFEGIYELLKERKEGESCRIGLNRCSPRDWKKGKMPLFSRNTWEW